MAKNWGETGWIKLWRTEMDSILYREEPFDKWHAWMDLCMMADSEGTVKTSLEALKIRWFWGSRHKVRDFLGTLEGTGKGTVISTTNKGTLIRLNTGNSGTSKYKKKGSQGTHKGTVKGNEEVILKKKENENLSDISSPEEKKIEGLSNADARKIFEEFL